MTTKITSANVAEIAAQWGSYMHNGDPGACMYGFTLTGRVQSEAHREQCLSWIAHECRLAARLNPDTAGDNAELDALADYIRNASRERP